MNALNVQSTSIPDMIETGKYYDFFFMPGFAKYNALKRPSLPYQEGFVQDVVTVDSADYNDNIQTVSYRVCVTSPNAQAVTIEPIGAINHVSGNLTLFDLKSVSFSPSLVQTITAHPIISLILFGVLAYVLFMGVLIHKFNK